MGVGIYLLTPLVATVEFSTRGPGSSRTLSAWGAIGSNADLLGAIAVSLELAVLTDVAMLLLLVPTMTWVHLRVPGMRRMSARANVSSPRAATLTPGTRVDVRVSAVPVLATAPGSSA